MTEKQRVMAQEALDRVTASDSLTNYPAIIAGFVDKGIPEPEIQPRVNVFTYQAWRAKGRQVRKGEHGVKVGTYREFTKRVEQPDGAETRETFKRPWHSTVFHITQTDPINRPERGKVASK